MSAFHIIGTTLVVGGLGASCWLLAASRQLLELRIDYLCLLLSREPLGRNPLCLLPEPRPIHLPS